MNRLGTAKVGAFGDSNSTSYTGAQSHNASPNKSSKDNVTKVMANDFVPKRFGLKYDPPAIVLEYLVPSSGKLYHHKMRMPQLKGDSETLDIIEFLQKKHSQYFLGNKVSETQITNLIEKLKKKLPATGGANTYGGSTFLTADDNGFASTGMKPGKLAPINSGLASKQSPGVGSSNASKGQDSKPTNAKNDKKAGNNFWELDDLEDVEDDDDEKIDYNNTNLNKLSKEEVQKHKDKMDVLFSKNQMKPGDEGFVYDKQEEFEPQVENEWDDDF